MGFPAIAGTPTSYSWGISTASRLIAIPADVVAGERLIAIITSDHTSAVTWTAPSGWTEIAEVSSGLWCNGAVFEKIADGSESGLVTAVASASCTNSVACCYRVSNAHPSAASEVATAAGTSTTPDPPSRTASWEADENLAIAVMGKRASAAFSAYPSGYTTDQLSATQGNVLSAMATRQTTGATEDPGSYTLGTSVGWWAATIMVRSAPPKPGGMFQMF